MASPIYGNPVRVAALENQWRATMAAVTQVRGTDVPQQAAMLGSEVVNTEISARAFGEANRLGAVVDVYA